MSNTHIEPSSNTPTLQSKKVPVNKGGLKPEFYSNTFKCPHCKVVSQQRWDSITTFHVKGHNYVKGEINIQTRKDGKNFHMSICDRCSIPSFWLEEDMIYPISNPYPEPNDDLSEQAKIMYNKAASVATICSEAACAMLRKVLEIMLNDIGKSGTIYKMIGDLKKEGLDDDLVDDLNIVRVIGNQAVHPGTIDFNDTVEVDMLFELINDLSDVLITKPKTRKERRNKYLNKS